MAPSQEVVPFSQDHTSTASLDRLDEILLTGEMEVEIIDDPAEISRQMMAELLAAPDDLALQDFGNAEPWGDYLGKPFEIHGFRYRKSDFEEGAPVYFVVQATLLEDGSRKVLTTGSMSVLAQLSNMARRGTLVGGVWQLTEAKEATRAGYHPRWLVQPDAVKKEAQAQQQALRDQPEPAPAPASQ